MTTIVKRLPEGPPPKGEPWNQATHEHERRVWRLGIKPTDKDVMRLIDDADALEAAQKEVAKLRAALDEIHRLRKPTPTDFKEAFDVMEEQARYKLMVPSEPFAQERKQLAKNRQAAIRAAGESTMDALGYGIVPPGSYDSNSLAPYNATPFKSLEEAKEWFGDAWPGQAAQKECPRCAHPMHESVSGHGWCCSNPACSYFRGVKSVQWPPAEPQDSWGVEVDNADDWGKEMYSHNGVSLQVKRLRAWRDEGKCVHCGGDIQSSRKYSCRDCGLGRPHLWDHESCADAWLAENPGGTRASDIPSCPECGLIAEEVNGSWFCSEATCSTSYFGYNP
jgi:hypothetical protein